jgi:hypothetical protein
VRHFNLEEDEPKTAKAPLSRTLISPANSNQRLSLTANQVKVSSFTAKNSLASLVTAKSEAEASN